MGGCLCLCLGSSDTVLLQQIHNREQASQTEALDTCACYLAVTIWQCFYWGVHLHHHGELYCTATPGIGGRLYICIGFKNENVKGWQGLQWGQHRLHSTTPRLRKRGWRVFRATQRFSIEGNYITKVFHWGQLHYKGFPLRATTLGQCWRTAGGLQGVVYYRCQWYLKMTFTTGRTLFNCWPGL